MIERFQGDDGRRRLLEALLSQQAVHHTPEMAEDLAKVVKLEEFKAGTAFIRQDAEDTDMFFILAGRADIVVNERVIAERAAGDHVGEMALIDLKAKRSASVIAKETTVVARITEPEFTTIAARHPTLWRYLALELANRLRERNGLVRVPNHKPHLFIGSSVESLVVAREIQSIMAHDKFVVKLWTDGVFTASSTTVRDLMIEVRRADFAHHGVRGGRQGGVAPQTIGHAARQRGLRVGPVHGRRGPGSSVRGQAAGGGAEDPHRLARHEVAGVRRIRPG
jgi:CRP-like cAMP-binding protein